MNVEQAKLIANAAELLELRSSIKLQDVEACIQALLTLWPTSTNLGMLEHIGAHLVEASLKSNQWIIEYLQHVIETGSAEPPLPKKSMEQFSNKEARAWLQEAVYQLGVCDVHEAASCRAQILNFLTSSEEPAQCQQ